MRRSRRRSGRVADTSSATTGPNSAVRTAAGRRTRHGRWGPGAALAPGVPAPEVRVVSNVDRQALVLPNGTILVSTSYLAVLENEAQLAGLLGHELGHFIGRHALVGKRYAAVSTSTVERMRLARSLEEEADETGLAL